MSTQALIMALLLALMSAVLFAVMAADKRRARRNMRRVPEARLFLLALLGGAAGGVFGMYVFHHKTKKLKFVLGFPVIALCQLGALAFLLLR